MDSIGVTVRCGSQCNFGSSLQNNMCGDLYSEFGIQQCNQASCSPRIYNLSACVNEATRNTTRVSPTVPNEPLTPCECDTPGSGDPDDFTNDMTIEQPQICTPTTVYRTETVNKTVTTSVTVTTCQDVSTTVTTSMLSTTITTNSNTTSNISSAVLALGALVGLLLVLLVIITTAWIWQLKMKRELKILLQQSR